MKKCDGDIHYHQTLGSSSERVWSLAWICCLFFGCENRLFDNVSPLNVSLVMKEINIAPKFGWSDFEEAGPRHMTFASKKRGSRTFSLTNKSINCLFNLVMKGIFEALQEKMARSPDGDHNKQ